MKDWDKELDKEIEAYKSWKDRFGGFSRDMTLRDYFAAMAMQGLLSSTKTADEKVIVEDAYHVADAMLKARKT